MEKIESALHEARAIAAAILGGSIKAGDGCASIAVLCETNNWPSALAPFAALAHEQVGHEKFGFNAQNTAPLIIQACRVLLADGPTMQS